MPDPITRKLIVFDASKELIKIGPKILTQNTKFPGETATSKPLKYDDFSDFVDFSPDSEIP